MESLAWEYLHLGELDEAERWFLDSTAENLIATLKQKGFQKLLEFKRKGKQKINALMNNMKASGEYISDITVLKHFSEELKSLADRNRNMLPGILSQSSTEDLSTMPKYWNCEKEIRFKAAEGFSYAKTLGLSMQYYMEGWRILHSYQSYLGFQEGVANKFKFATSTGLKNEMLRAFANCFRTTEIVAFFSHEKRAMLTEIAKQTMNHFKDEMTKMDIDARICYSSMILMSSLQEALNFLEVSKLKYPNEMFFPCVQINLLGFLEKFPEALQKSIDTLKRFPNNVDLLQSKAKLMYLTLCDSKDRENTEEIKNAFQTFLGAAPRDHRKVPDAYYCLGCLSLRLQPKDFKEAEYYLRAGIEAENKLLSCFIPYDSDHKVLLNLLIDTLQAMHKMPLTVENGEDNNTSGKIQLQEQHKTKNGMFNFIRSRDASLSQMQQTNPMRIHVVLKYRKNLKKVLTRDRKGYKVFTNTSKPMNEQKLPSVLTGLQEITLDEMNPTTDHVYSSKVLHATIMEDCIFDCYTSIHTVIKDDSGDFRLCYFYNFNQKDVETRQKFSFGSRISILNPYHRLTVDLGFGIRIDDPQSVVFHSAGDDTPICRFCCKPDPAERCSKCKRANYCCKNCQLKDWSKLKHGLICRPLHW